MPSKYQPQVSAWRQDLHKWVYTTKLHLSNNKKLRYANDDYCEFSRRLGGGILLVGLQYFFPQFLFYYHYSLYIWAFSLLLQKLMVES
ncbi:MAG: hypothetical protein J6569_09215 [Gilliamella sp.]|uniref:hypothetical protein n=1 Tax=Gilliamella sp. TaxID=1891236 RepID=UPI0025D7FA9B|nr:hypothetical protein [Gilliamella sp.]MCO6540300.1 hypothetical protein [Gilliamella sp.]